jgi:hypothetical protein
VASRPENWRLILDAAETLTASGQTPFSRISIYEWIWRRYPRAEHDRPSLDPTLQGMTSNAPGGPPSPCGTPLHRTGHGRYVLSGPPAQSRVPSSSSGIQSSAAADRATAPLIALQTGPLFSFADWPNHQLPTRAAGVYTIWQEEAFFYVGMSGRGAQTEGFVAEPGPDSSNKTKWLWTRLNSHASGRRSGDQFNVYICDRFIVPILTPAQQHEVGRGQLLLDQMTKSFIREHLSYRFQVYPNGQEALNAERAVRAGGLPAGRPLLNPL